MKTLVISEKPTAAKKIATALDENEKPKVLTKYGIQYFECSRNSDIIYVIPSIGHLYTIKQEGKGWDYPIYSWKWVPLYEVDKKAKRVQNFIKLFTAISKNVDRFVVATDYDIEGSVIGYNIVKFACSEDAINRAYRMKFSTLTKEELINSYDNLMNSLDFEIVNAGITRHQIDWLYGINLTRALTLSLKNTTNWFKILSTGRVQGPTLKFIIDKENEIDLHIPIPYWNAKILFEINGKEFFAIYKRRINTKQEVRNILNIKNKQALVSEIKESDIIIKPPTPFNLSALQSEAFRLFSYSPKRTLQIAQKLYLDALISYPRTNSQQFPESIKIDEILKKLETFNKYKQLIKQLKGKKLTPTKGEKKDPAHPPIHPTGEHPTRALSQQEVRIFELIIRRFLAILGENAIKTNIIASLDLEGFIFTINGTHIKKEGWRIFYKPYLSDKDIDLPNIQEGQAIPIKDIIIEDKFTKPPSRYTYGSLLKKLEYENLGTKATRAEIIENIHKRGYVIKKSFEPTQLGRVVINTLKRFAPEIISPEMTRNLELKMNAIQEKKIDMQLVMNEAVENLKQILNKFKEKEKDIGTSLSEGLKLYYETQRVLGTCPVCKTGKLVIIYSKKTKKRFVGCTNYFEGTCNVSRPLPQKGTIYPTKEICSKCGFPVVKISSGKRLRKMCVNWINCTKKETDGDTNE